MTPDLMATALAPIVSWRAAEPAVRSDFDLNPDMTPPGGDVVEAAVLVVLAQAAAGPEVILTRRADTLARHTGQIAFPGGRLDPGETAVEAALREAWEEVGLSPDDVSLLGLGDRYRTGTGYLVTPVVAWADAPPRLTPSPAEVAEIFAVPWAHLVDPANRRRDHYELEGVRRHFWSIDWRNRVIWGATAGMIVALADRLAGRAERAA
ncbi:CoA pyrophosphatase [Brevundimonas sp.]|jgi:8-oxo-dGTP pyrophosphatase MutT (NUDIX family)|uniref:NUDIX hydrolase n=1 Tax=Brevundimonas sp. TaxID=1871086 RepID=UPI002E1506DC|nr:CoA pyrophosphatase [Brevundimonas sp.]